ncbi:MAG: YbhB/YbcL family Raf kinase inhibitor-like protein [Candidatus Omnitrophica bacterium]|nr:YbhB/YbcL family Raf kinase inhibitor-like protein [Candidatus Omnitrophota bacterium]
MCIVLSVVLLFASSEASGLEIASDVFKDGETIPIEFTGKGENSSPPLRWSDVPDGTKSFALVMDDPDAPMGTWVHWVIYNIPEESRSLPEGVPRDFTLENGTLQGINSFRWAGYGGPSPPPGSTHRYFFKLYALDRELELAPGANKGQLMRAIQGNILDRAELVGVFE